MGSAYADGVIKIRRLNPHAVVAFSSPRSTFDSNQYHRIEVAVRGHKLEVALDGDLVVFDQNGAATKAPEIAPTWEGPPALGENLWSSKRGISRYPLIGRCD